MGMMSGTPGYLPPGVQPTLVVQNVRLVSVITGEDEILDIVIADHRIAAFWPCGTPTDLPAIDGRRRYAVPGFIDSHLHIESSFVTPEAYAEAVLIRGTTTCAADAHEITNVLGPRGLEAFMDSAHGLPVDIRWMVPSSVPSVPGLEGSGGSMEPHDVQRLLKRPDVLGLGEVMDAYGIARGEQRMQDILQTARDAGVMLEGHAPDVTDEALTALLYEGVDSDHSKSTTLLLMKKIRLGMFLEFQAKTLRAELIEALQALPIEPSYALCTDDVSADVLADQGHLDRIGRLAVAVGMDPLKALKAMTFYPSQRLRLYDRGILSPGKRADILLLDSLSDFRPAMVIVGGEVLAEHGALTPRGQERVHGQSQKRLKVLDGLRHSIHLTVASLTPSRFVWTAPSHLSSVITLRALSLNQEDNYTREVALSATITDGQIQLPAEALLLTVINRYSGNEEQTFAPILGQSLRRGALASTYSHDAHNLTVLGNNAEDMALAAQTVVALGGGMVVVEEGQVVAQLALPLAGVVSDQSLDTVVDAAKNVRDALFHWGYRHQNPFMNVSTMGLLVSPEIRLSDLGLIDVRTRRQVSSWIEIQNS